MYHIARILPLLGVLSLSLVATGCSTSTDVPVESDAPSSGAAVPSVRAACAGVYVPQDGAHPRPEVWTAFEDQAALDAALEGISDVKKGESAFGDVTYKVPSIDDVEQYWGPSERDQVLPDLPDTNRADYYVLVVENGLCVNQAA